MYKNILVPLDGSKRAEVILSHVEQLARLFQAKVVLLQVVEPVYVDSELPETAMGLSQELTRQKADEAASYLAGCQGVFREKGIQAVTRVELGPVVGTIIRVAEREGSDLIAMTSHGRGGLARVFYGSVTAGILQRVDRPLLIIRSTGNE
ncbi:MAG: universal stress protein [Anaerolineales bacterium]|jgi:nucleotide-binding universal stress UspA family protein